MLQLAATDDKGTSRGYAKSAPEVPGKCFSNPAQCLFVLRCKCTARKELHRCGCRIKLARPRLIPARCKDLKVALGAASIG